MESYGTDVWPMISLLLNVHVFKRACRHASGLLELNPQKEIWNNIRIHATEHPECPSMR